MAAEVSSPKKRKHRGFMTLLSYAACEWLLILMLLVDAIFSYLLTRFAQCCGLQTPCPLCSRFDHAWSLVCSNHKEEISSLVYCSVHGKLADVHRMCEECLMPITVKKDSESCKLLVGKSWMGIEQSILQNLILSKHVTLGCSGSRACSCCNKTLRAKPNAESPLEFKAVRFGASKANVKPPLPRGPRHIRFSRRDSFKKLRGKLTEPVPIDSNSVGTLSGVGYTKLKISSDSESDFPLSEDDDDDGYASSCGNNYIKPECNVEFGARELSETPVRNVSSHQLIHLGSEVKDQPHLLDLNDPKNVNSSFPDDFIEHGLRELNYAESYKKPSHLITTQELISLDDVSLLTSLGDTHSSESNSKIHIDSLSQSAKNIELSCEHEIEPVITSDPGRTEECTKSISQVSTSKVGLSTEDIGLKPHDERNVSREGEHFSSQALLPSASLKRNDSSYDSLDGISVSEIEGESIIDRLRRQVEHDRSCMKSLCKELEEERNAAAIAANEAMAMITRLQEEKAALHMEARQHLRMMEQQAQYHMEALERTNDLLDEKEKQLQDLEAELELYRNSSPDESGIEDVRKRTSVLDNHVASHSESNTGASGDSESAKISKANGKYKSMSSSLSNFEAEKHYISQCLEKLEKNIRQVYSSGETLSDLEIGHDTPLVQNHISASNGSPVQDTASNGTLAYNEENNIHYRKSENLSDGRGDTNSAGFEKEIAILHERLRALETGLDLVKHASNLLQNGKDGQELIQGIAHQLQELRKIEFRKR